MFVMFRFSYSVGVHGLLLLVSLGACLCVCVCVSGQWLLRCVEVRPSVRLSVCPCVRFLVRLFRLGTCACVTIFCAL